MADLTKTVDPDGTGDYTSQNLFESTEQQNLVTGTNTMTCTCISSGGTKDTTAVVYNGWTTSDTYYLKVQQSRAHGAAWNTSSYILQVANARVCHINGMSMIIDGLQIELSSSSADYQECLYIAGAANETVTVSNCMFKSSNSATYRERAIYISGTTSRELKFYNNIIWNVNALPAHTANSCVYQNTGGGNFYYVENNTFSGGYNTVADAVGTDIVWVNNILIPSNATDGGAKFNAASDYNTTTKASTGIPGANNSLNQTFTFVDAANGDFTLQAADTGAQGKGTNAVNSGFTDDIVGTARTVPWDCGAYQVPAAGVEQGMLYHHMDMMRH